MPRKPRLVRRVLNEVAVTVEQMPNEQKKQFVNWIVIEQVEPFMFTCGGSDLTSIVIPCIVQIYLPHGVLDAAARFKYVALMHGAFEKALPKQDERRLVTSVILNEVPDGQWGGNAKIWRLPDFATAAEYSHLQGAI
jgi:phenylpyruvate tautomerase PptA (4-oxalocrotonate tautomerase family)